MGDYAATYPTNVAVDERVGKFISAFYAISDTPSRNEDWVDCFAPDALFVVNGRKVEGVEGKRAPAKYLCLVSCIELMSCFGFCPRVTD